VYSPIQPPDAKDSFESERDSLLGKERVDPEFFKGFAAVVDRGGIIFRVVANDAAIVV
jgi:hypothetical protein